MVSSGITKDDMSKSKVDPCGVCSLRVKENTAMCLQCGKWTHSRCTRVSVDGGREAAVTSRTRCGWIKFWECGELLYGRRFLLKQKGSVYKSYVRPAIQYGSESWCHKECEMGILRRTERSMVRAICGVQPRDIKRSTDLIFMLGLNETIDQLAMTNSVRWYGHVLRREDGDILRRALDYEAEGRKGGQRGHGKSRLRKKV